LEAPLSVAADHIAQAHFNCKLNRNPRSNRLQEFTNRRLQSRCGGSTHASHDLPADRVAHASEVGKATYPSGEGRMMLAGA